MACFFRSLMRVIPNRTRIWWRLFLVCASGQFCSRSSTCLKYIRLLFVPVRDCDLDFPLGFFTFTLSSSSMPPTEKTEPALDRSSSSIEDWPVLVRFMADSMPSSLREDTARGGGDLRVRLTSRLLWLKGRGRQEKRMLWGWISLCLFLYRNWVEPAEVYSDWEAMLRKAMSWSPYLLRNMLLFFSFSMRSVVVSMLFQS